MTQHSPHPGCDPRVFEATVADVAHTLAVGARTLKREDKELPPFVLPNRRQRVRGYVSDMEDYLRDTVRKYSQAVGNPLGRLKTVLTDFLIAEAKGPICYVEKDAMKPIG